MGGGGGGGGAGSAVALPGLCPGELKNFTKLEKWGANSVSHYINLCMIVHPNPDDDMVFYVLPTVFKSC